ncbi:uncharacterized protein APUU_70416S [Aspergillus puulaauensis]|uniref:Uncharacterized protein n=1 Tax=Aspergillus puulaauensis TaxID=1220207 RepID=A0A7R7XW57_9EURO|nr:uncharacterized protein APUU_70416S [Aspergillus puulaauensis]BCS28846.1 hypothetical protein APUU_70416S [Aspergillus puulaauensis]
MVVVHRQGDSIWYPHAHRIRSKSRATGVNHSLTSVSEKRMRRDNRLKSQDSAKKPQYWPGGHSRAWSRASGGENVENRGVEANDDPDVPGLTSNRRRRLFFCVVALVGLCVFASSSTCRGPCRVLSSDALTAVSTVRQLVRKLPPDSLVTTQVFRCSQQPLFVMFAAVVTRQSSSSMEAPSLGFLGLAPFSGSRFSRDNFAAKGLSGGDGPFFSPFRPPEHQIQRNQNSRGSNPPPIPAQHSPCGMQSESGTAWSEFLAL